MDQLTSAKETMKVTINQDFVSIHIAVRSCAWNEACELECYDATAKEKKKLLSEVFASPLKDNYVLAK